MTRLGPPKLSLPVFRPRAPVISGPKFGLPPTDPQAMQYPQPPGQMDPDTQAMLDQIYPNQAPQMQQSPDFNLGPIHLNGNRLDAASLAVLQALQNQPAPRNFGGGLAMGLAQGFAGARGSQAVARETANTQALKDQHAMEMEKRKTAASILAKGRFERMKVTNQDMADALGVNVGDMVPTSSYNAAIGVVNRKDPSDPDVDVTAPAMQAFFKRIHFDQPPGTTTMKRSQLVELGKPSTAAGTAVAQPGVGGQSAFFWGTVAGKGGTVPFGVLRGMTPDDKAAFTAGAQSAAGSAGGYVGNSANVAGLKSALTATQRTKAGFDAMDILLEKSTKLLKDQIAKVPDTGTQFGNDIVRYWNAKSGGTGATNFYAVLSPVQSEATRVITSGTLNGQPISDHARADLQAVAGRSFTKEQLIGALDLLGQERGFRRQGFEQTISGLQSALGMAPTPQSAPDAGPTVSSYRSFMDSLATQPKRRK